MNDAFALQNFFGLAEVIANIGLGFNPIDIALNSVFQLDLRFVTGRPDQFRIAGEMAHFAGTKFAARFQFDVDLEESRENLG